MIRTIAIDFTFSVYKKTQAFVLLGPIRNSDQVVPIHKFHIAKETTDDICNTKEKPLIKFPINK